MSLLDIARRARLACAGAAFASVALTGLAEAQTQTFNRPMHPQGNRLDWCFNWAEGCGKDAADAFCRHHGYADATTFAKATDIGNRHKTRVISTGAVCDRNFCDGFAAITCVRASNVVFRRPMHPRGNRLDWCFDWAQGCGREAADAFCRAKGHARGAQSFTKATDIGDRYKTRVISTGAVCDRGFCDGFGEIVCRP